MAEQANLTDFVTALAGDKLRVESDLGDGFVRLRVSEAERRQAKQDIRCVEDAVIEMLRNARDAHARFIIVGISKSGSTRRIVMVDDGDGVPDRLREQIFEPRVTSKLDSMHMDDWGVHGRGMALYSIRENAIDAACKASVEGQGSAFAVAFDTQELLERSDQSTAPELIKQADGQWTVGSSPHNIIRATAEFALANRQVCTVYLGSFVDAAATLYAYGKQFLPAGCNDDPQSVAPMKRLGLARDARDVLTIAETLGFDFSNRSAHRIAAREVAPLEPLLETLDRRHEGVAPISQSAKPKALHRDFRGLKIADDDMEEFKQALQAAYSQLAEQYYLDSEIEPQVRLAPEGLHVTFPVSKL